MVPVRSFRAGEPLPRTCNGWRRAPVGGVCIPVERAPGRSGRAFQEASCPCSALDRMSRASRLVAASATKEEDPARKGRVLPWKCSLQPRQPPDPQRAARPRAPSGRASLQPRQRLGQRGMKEERSPRRATSLLECSGGPLGSPGEEWRPALCRNPQAVADLRPRGCSKRCRNALAVSARLSLHGGTTRIHHATHLPHPGPGPPTVQGGRRLPAPLNGPPGTVHPRPEESHRALRRRERLRTCQVLRRRRDQRYQRRPPTAS